MDLMDVLSGLMNNSSSTKKLGSKVGIDAEKVMQLAKLGLPALMAALNKNANTKESASSLYQALEQHQDDQVDDIENFLENVDTEDGEKMVNHIFQNKKAAIEKTLSKQSGLDLSQVASLLQRFAPLLLGLLANKKKEGNINLNNLSQLTSSLSNSMSQNSENSGIMGVFTQMLDSDKDGNIIDDIGNFLGNMFKK